MSATRFKRPGEEDFANGNPFETDEHSAKKPRFDVRNPSTLAADAPEDDAVLALDEIGAGLRTKRNAVNVDGYESDSSTENFDARAEAKSKAADDSKKKASKDEEDEDMFADLEEEFKDGDDDEELQREGKKKKGVRFLEDDEIEGQVHSSKAQGHVYADLSSTQRRGKGRATEDGESSEDDEEGDEVRDHIPMGMDPELGAGSKKKHAPRIDAFNMKQEQEEGRFDENGNYVRKARDQDEQYDNWLEGVSKRDIKRAKEAHEKREEERRARDLEGDAVLTSGLLAKLIPRLEKGETVMEALQRLNKGRKPKPKPKPKWLQKSKKKNNGANDNDAMEVEEDPQEAAKEAKLKEAIDDVTDAATGLFNKGQTDIWDAERELLVRQYKRETGDDWVDKVEDNGEAMWNYRWTNGDGQIYGPYDGPTMQSWSDQGFFAAGVDFQRAGESEWSRLVDFV